MPSPKPYLTRSVDFCITRTRVQLFAGIVALVLGAGIARSQDTHYWNLFYGTEATLLGGTVIGSASDLSATYYNPGMLAVNREQGLVLGANVYQYQRFTIDQSLEGSTSNSRIAPAPGLVAGRLPVDSGIVRGVAYSILTRQFLQANLESRFIGAKDIVGNDGVPEHYTSDLAFDAGLSDTWLGVTLFRLVDPHVGIGLTNYVAVRNQKTRSFASGSILANNGTVTSAMRILDIDYYNVRVLWKFGIGVDLDPLTIGLTVTTPSLNLFGSGSLFATYTSSSAGVSADTSKKNVLIGGKQEDVSSRYKTSWAVGGGIGYRAGKSRIHFSAEWYAPVSLYSVLSTSGFTGQSDGKQYPLEIMDERRAVFNVGVGFQYSLSPTLGLFGSLVTDFSTVPEGTTSNLSLTPWDLVHLSFGTVLSFTGLDLTIGASFARGDAPAQDIPWSRAAGSLGQVVGTPSDLSISYLSATGILAFAFKL